MGEPDVTVVVPVYNTMPYLTATLDSLVGQTLDRGRFEVVAVDDGSTDGSGAELDRYAATHPGLFTVVHQPNSGGPAGPCNVGLERAHGRYVFFLGADDFLGEEALARMVAKADEWESDVLCARIVGEGGRWVNQLLYARDVADVPFPSAEVASALSNTKLFRRSLLTDHAITFSRDLAVGSDQPFTIEAMLHARRISALGDYDYYHAVKRADASNITYSSDWRARLAGIAAIIEHVAGLIEPGEGRDLLLGRHFSGEIATVLRRDFHDAGPAEQDEMVAAVNALASAYLTEPMLPRLRVLDRWRFVLAGNGSIEELRALAGLDEQPATVQVDGDRVVLHYPGLPPSLAAEDDRVGRHLSASLGPATIVVDRSRASVSVPVTLAAGSAPVARIAVAHVRAGQNPPPRSYALDPAAGLLAEPADLRDGALEADLDLDRLRAQAGGTSLLALRVQFDIGARTYGVPVPFGRSQPAVGREGVDHRVIARADGSSMTLIEVQPSGGRKLKTLRARWGRKK